jgi:hypothetical protein
MRFSFYVRQFEESAYVCLSKESFFKLGIFHTTFLCKYVLFSVGYVGPSCSGVCEVNPCSNGAHCVENPLSQRGYSCKCNSSEYSGTLNNDFSAFACDYVCLYL